MEIRQKCARKKKKAKLEGAFVKKEKLKLEDNDKTYGKEKIDENKEVNDTNQVVDIKKSGLVKEGDQQKDKRGVVKIEIALTRL